MFRLSRAALDNILSYEYIEMAVAQPNNHAECQRRSAINGLIGLSAHQEVPKSPRIKLPSHWI